MVQLVIQPDRVLLASNAQVSPTLRFGDPLCARRQAALGRFKPLPGSHFFPIINPER